MKSYLRKTPMQKRREAERSGNATPGKPLAKSDFSKRPAQHSDSGDALRATAEWLSFIRTGRIEAR